MCRRAVALHVMSHVATREHCKGNEKQNYINKFNLLTTVRVTKQRSLISKFPSYKKITKNK